MIDPTADFPPDPFPSTPQMPDLELMRQIGAGGFGQVWLARNRTTGHLRAVKVIPLHRSGTVDPAGREKGLLMVFNPLERRVSKRINVPLYYTGLERNAKISEKDTEPKPYQLARNYSVSVDVDLAARGLTWFVIE